MGEMESFAGSSFSPEAKRQSHHEVTPRQNLILIGDDDPAFCRTLRLMLQSAGYSVLAASSGAEAVALFGLRADEIDLVILDLDMPGMDGGETLRDLRRIRPDVKAVLCSGTGTGDPGADALKLDWAGALAKPVEADTLLRLVRELVSGP